MTGVDFSSVPDKQPWPQKGDQLFTSGDDWWHNACLNYGSDDWELYIVGYKKAGDALVEHVGEVRHGQDYFVFPIIFVYRQYLELRIKKLIRDSKNLLAEPPQFAKTHDLSALWIECRPLLEKLEPKAETDDLDAVGEAIQQFCELDPSSEAFRYPVTRKDTPSLPSDLRYINLRILSEVMDKMSSFLEAAEMMVLVYLDHKHDMESDFGASY